MAGEINSIYVRAEDKILTNKGFVKVGELEGSIIQTYNGKEFINSYVKGKINDMESLKIVFNNYIPIILGKISNTYYNINNMSVRTKIINFPFTSITGRNSQKNVDMFTQGVFSSLGNRYMYVKYMHTNDDIMENIGLLDYSSLNNSKANRKKMVMFFRKAYIEHSIPFGFSRPDKGRFISGYMFFNSKISKNYLTINYLKKRKNWNDFKLLLNECGIDYIIRENNILIHKHFFYGFKKKHIFSRYIEHKKYDKFIYPISRNLVSREDIVSDVIEIRRTDYVCINGIFL